ncbi:MAG: hypothetical protein HY727_05670 [Candidatus Rokubacteria bacterium]|nr:hypothetical protein [Candidatus Rokubacteria bacterium]
MNAERPGYWDIVIAYIREGHRAWKAGDVGYGVEVERALGLSDMEGHRFIQYLEGLGLVEYEQATNALGAFHLLPKGLAFAERMPDIEDLLAEQTKAIRVGQAGEAEKRQAGFSLRDEMLKTAVNKGADVAIQNASSIWTFMRTVYSWLPQDWRHL